MKRVSPGTVTIGIVAIVLGLVTAHAVRRYLADPVKGVEVLVSRVNLPKYARIQSSNIEVVKLPAERVPETAIRNKGRAVSRLVEQTIEAGQVLTEEKLFTLGEEPVMAEQLPPGYRAVTITIDQDQALAGVLLPESLIDVSMTVGGGQGRDAPEPMTVTLVREVRVLATSQQRHRFAESSRRPLRTITLAVTPEQSNKLILAQQYGRLSVSLRSSLEEVENGLPHTASLASGAVDRISTSDLLGLPPRNAPIKTQIWRGSSMSEITFRPAQIDESRQATFAAEKARTIVPASYDKVSTNQ